MIFQRLLRFSYRMVLLALGLALAAGAGWGVKLGLDHLVYRNADYQLRHIELNPNEAITERDLIELTGLDLHSNIFSVRTAEISRKLQAYPPILSAEVKRKAPDTLVVTVQARSPVVWLVCPEAGLPAGREVGGMLLAADGMAYQCPAPQLGRAESLPLVVLDSSDEAAIRAGETVRHPHLEDCLRLVDAARQQDRGGLEWIESVRQHNEWSLALTTRKGVVAIIGLEDHARQLSYLHRSMEHAAMKGYSIATINLIPRRNVPLTLASAAIPKAIPVSEEELEEESGQSN